MKYYFILVILLSSKLCYTQCPPGDVSIYNQALLNQFIIDYPNCTNLNASMFISGVSDLTPLNNVIESIHGIFTITNTSLLNLDGLTSLNSVGTYMSIKLNSSLLNLDGLTSLNSVGSYINIQSNSSLLNLNGLSNLQTIGGGG